MPFSLGEKGGDEGAQYRPLRNTLWLTFWKQNCSMIYLDHNEA